MLEILPNVRQAVLIVSGLFLLCAIAIVGFTAYSKRVQTDQYRFVEGQWFGLVAIFVFGLVFGFGWSLPKPEDRPMSIEQRRSEAFQNYYDSCHNVSTDRVDCTLLARQQADIALGTTAMVVKVVRTTVKPEEQPIDRASRYDRYFSQCKSDLPFAHPNTNTYSSQQLNYCRAFAAQQIRTALQ